MNALTCPYSVLSAELQARNLFHHTAFGLVRYISKPPTAQLASHPLDFAYLLGLTTKLPWHLPPHIISLITRESVKQVLMLAAQYLNRPLAEFDTFIISQRLRAIPAQQEQCVRFAKFILANVYFLPRSERYIAMKAEPEMSNLPADTYKRLDMGLAGLEASLLAKDPLMPQHLRSIHALLISYPESVHLLEDKEIATLIAAAESHTKTEIIKAAAKGGAGSGSKKKVSVSDL